MDENKHQRGLSRGRRSSSTAAPREAELNRIAGGNLQPTLKMLAYVDQNKDLLSTTIMEFHMTIRPKVSELTPRQASMLLAIAVYRATNVGVDFTLYLAIEWLHNFLRKSGWDTLWISNERQRQTVLLSELVLAAIRGTWLTFKEYEPLEDEVREKILSSEWLPSERTMQSWKQNWAIERFLEVRIVPVETLIKRDKLSSAERYSAYTRGYGQDGNPPASGKTRPSPELDGEDYERPTPEFNLQEFETYVDIINSIEKAKAMKRNK